MKDKLFAIILDGLVMAAGKSKVRLFRKGEMK